MKNTYPKNVDLERSLAAMTEAHEKQVEFYANCYDISLEEAEARIEQAQEMAAEMLGGAYGF
jgi:hypothetical protein